MKQDHGTEMQRLLRQYLEHSGHTVWRLHDQQSGYSGSVNPADFLTAFCGETYLVEVKCTKNSSLSFSALTQHQRESQRDTLSEKSKRNHVNGVVVFGYCNRGVKWIPAEDLFRIEREERKSLRWEDHPEFNIDCPAPRYTDTPKIVAKEISPVNIIPGGGRN